MSITGQFPETGIRVEIERSREATPPWTYRGYAVTPSTRWAMTAIVSAAGAVTVDLAAGAPEGTKERVRRMVRAAWKHAQRDDDGKTQGRPESTSESPSGPPRRIVRWRDR